MSLSQEDKEKLDQAASAVGIGKIRRHIFLCADQTDPKCSSRDESLASWNYLKRRLAELGLTQGEQCVYRTKVNCLRVCRNGPIAVVYPEGVWYGNVQISDVAEIIASHIVGDCPVARLQLADGCVNNPECVHRAARQRS